MFSNFYQFDFTQQNGLWVALANLITFYNLTCIQVNIYWGDFIEEGRVIFLNSLNG